jgi:hypothetical protein
MFNKSFKARVEGYDCRVRKQKGNNEEQAYVRLHLLFEFSAEVAAEIGGPAPRIHEIMTRESDEGAIGAVPLRLNSRAVNVRFHVGNKHHVVKDTIDLALRATPPGATSLEPMLAVRVSFLAGPNDVAMLWEHLGNQVAVRMDREQLELPGMGNELESDCEAAL